MTRLVTRGKIGEKDFDQPLPKGGIVRQTIGGLRLMRRCQDSWCCKRVGEPTDDVGVSAIDHGDLLMGRGPAGLTEVLRSD